MKVQAAKTRKNAFQFHIGGYLKPNYALRQVVLYPNKDSFELTTDLARLFEYIDLSKLNSVMIPGVNAMKIADFSSKMFLIE